MTGHCFPASCMECGREDVPSFLCAECRDSAAYKPIVFAPDPDQMAEQERALAAMDTLTHGIGITGPDGKHIAIQDFFAQPETETRT